MKRALQFAVAGLLLAGVVLAQSLPLPSAPNTNGGPWVNGTFTGDVAVTDDVTADTITLGNATSPVVIPSNGEVCFDGAACTRYIRHTSAANRLNITATASEWINLNQNVELDAALIFSAGSGNNGVITNSAAGRPVMSNDAQGFCVGDGTALECDGMLSHGLDVSTVQAITVASTGDGSPATNTLTPSSSFVSYTCNDADTCDVTLSETGAANGSIVRITNVGANVVDFADSSGVTELAGAFAMGQYDSLTLMYATDRWVELCRSNN